MFEPPSWAVAMMTDVFHPEAFGANGVWGSRVQGLTNFLSPRKVFYFPSAKSFYHIVSCGEGKEQESVYPI